MVLVRPNKSDEITAEDFGQPVYDGIIRRGVSRSGIVGTLASNGFTVISWSSTIADLGGYVSGATNLVVPAGLDGLYVAVIQAEFTTSSGPTSSLATYMGPTRYDTLVPSGGRVAATVMRPMAAGEICYFAMWNSHSTVLTPTISRCDFYRVSL